MHFIKPIKLGIVRLSGKNIEMMFTLQIEVSGPEVKVHMLRKAVSVKLGGSCELVLDGLFLTHQLYYYILHV